MNHLRVLVIEPDAKRQERIAAVLGDAHYDVLPAASFSEGMNALLVQRFDAVLVGSPGDTQAHAGFTAALRRIERSKGLPSKTPVLLCSASIPTEMWAPAQTAGVDAYLGEHFAAATFTDAVLKLAEAVAPVETLKQRVDDSDLPIFEPDEFQAQVAYDTDLLVEIIDLFLAEHPTQVADMEAALTGGDFNRLGRVAHTLKGSLGSLHAMLARSHAQDLEGAAKAGNGEVCRFYLVALQQDLGNLEPELLALRSRVS